MKRYLLYRVLWIPLTLIGILLFIFSLSTFLLEKSESPEWDTNSDYLTRSTYAPSHELAKHYGLGFPLLWNRWKKETQEEIKSQLENHFVFYEKKIPFQKAQLEELAYLYPHHKKIQEAFLLSREANGTSKSKSPPTRLHIFFNRLMKFDFGPSDYFPNQKISWVIWQHFCISFPLLGFSAVFSFLGALGLGGVLAHYHQKFWVFFLNTLLLVSYALPIYLVVPLLLDKGLIPFKIFASAKGPFWQIGASLSEFTLALLSLSYGAMALFTRLAQSLFQSINTQPHVLSAKALGVSPMRIKWVHILRPVLASFIPLFCASLQTLLLGLILVENLFEIRGFGYLFYHALLQKDLAVILGCSFFASSLTLISHLAADFFTFILDPRVRNHDYPAYQAYP